MRGRSHRTPENRQKLLDLLAEDPNVSKACEAIKLPRTCFYEWEADNKEFRKEVEIAIERGFRSLEDEAVRRGRDGVIEPVYYKGKVVGGVRKYSDTLLLATLNANLPEKYRRVGPNGQPAEDTVIVVKIQGADAAL